jgi:hypothetical protein
VSIKENAEFKCSEALELFMSNLLKEAKINAKYEKLSVIVEFFSCCYFNFMKLFFVE